MQTPFIKVLIITFFSLFLGCSQIYSIKLSKRSEAISSIFVDQIDKTETTEPTPTPTTTPDPEVTPAPTPTATPFPTEPPIPSSEKVSIPAVRMCTDSLQRTYGNPSDVKTAARLEIYIYTEQWVGTKSNYILLGKYFFPDLRDQLLNNGELVLPKNFAGYFLVLVDPDNPHPDIVEPGSMLAYSFFMWGFDGLWTFTMRRDDVRPYSTRWPVYFLYDNSGPWDGTCGAF